LEFNGSNEDLRILKLTLHNRQARRRLVDILGPDLVNRLYKKARRQDFEINSVEGDLNLHSSDRLQNIAGAFGDRAHGDEAVGGIFGDGSDMSLLPAQLTGSSSRLSTPGGLGAMGGATTAGQDSDGHQADGAVRSRRRRADGTLRFTSRSSSQSDLISNSENGSNSQYGGLEHGAIARDIGPKRHGSLRGSDGALHGDTTADLERSAFGDEPCDPRKLFVVKCRWPIKLHAEPSTAALLPSMEPRLSAYLKGDDMMEATPNEEQVKEAAKMPPLVGFTTSSGQRDLATEFRAAIDAAWQRVMKGADSNQGCPADTAMEV